MSVIINGSNTPTAGGVTYGDGTQYATTSAGTSGQVLQSNGASAPSWSSVASLTTAPTLQTFIYTPKAATAQRGASQAVVPYSRTSPSTTVTITLASHGWLTGDTVYIANLTGTIVAGWYTVTSATSNSFTITTVANTTTSGNVTIYPPIVITASSHGLSNGATVLLGDLPSSAWNDYSTYTVYGAQTDTFQIQTSSAPTSNLNISATATTLPQNGTTAYTWTKPTGCKKILVQLVGGGGGYASSGSGFGTGAGYSQELIDVSAVSSVSITVGTVGSSGYWTTLSSTYTNGGTTSFGAYCSATGGAGYGGSGSALFDSISVAGVGSGGDLNLRGFGSNSQMGQGAVISSAGNQVVGTCYGYGAGGASYSGCSPTVAQGTGGAVFVTEYY